MESTPSIPTFRVNKKSGIVASSDDEYRRLYRKHYYIQNRERIIANAHKRYQRKRSQEREVEFEIIRVGGNSTPPKSEPDS
jgi:hypothetical protein